MFLSYINDHPNIIIRISKPALLADDISIIIANSSPIYYKNNIIQIFKNINNWFKANLLTLNFDKTYCIQFFTRTSHAIDMHIDYDNNQTVKSTNPKFVELIINNMLLWKRHVDWLMSKLGSVCYAVRDIKPHMSEATIRMIYFSYFLSFCHDLGIIF